MLEPKPGYYTDSVGTVYRATQHAKSKVWSIQKAARFNGTDWHSLPFERADFPAAVHAGRFTYSSDTL